MVNISVEPVSDFAGSLLHPFITWTNGTVDFWTNLLLLYFSDAAYMHDIM